MAKGYKALGENMEALFGDGMQYEMNTDYTMEVDKIIPGKQGYHFFDNLRDIFYLFNNKEYSIYEIEANDYIEKINDADYIGKYVTNNIKIVRKLSKEEINKYIKDNLYILVNNENTDYSVRREVAKHGYGLDILVNDNDWEVRQEVAKHGYGLDILVNDRNWAVRREVARQGYGLNKLINDKNENVKREATIQMLKEKTK